MEAEFQAALDQASIKIEKFHPAKRQPIVTNRGTFTIDKFGKYLLQKISNNLAQYPQVTKALFNPADLEKLIEGAVQETPTAAPVIPDECKGLTLNIDLSATGQRPKFFMTDQNEFISMVTGTAYLAVCQIPDAEAALKARRVIPRYAPRRAAGTMTEKDEQGNEQKFLNTYALAPWRRYVGKLPDRLPASFDKLVKHLFPIAEEREFFFSWLYHSMFKRSYTYLILCGPPGTGKNRLKLVMRALHGHSNTIDGKKSTLVERFNSQLSEATLAWFDELHYSMEMENTMKELQNDSISIEKKGIDATRSTRIYSSLVISNNKPRDNYIAFDARKFAPLQIAQKRLETSLSEAEIDEITKKTENWDSKHYDLAYIAQIGRWIKKHGKSKKWPHLEYKGPMFWKLAHTSMSRWQKKAASMLIEATKQPPPIVTVDPQKGFLWSSMHELSQKKNGERSLQFPDYSSVQHFFDIFRDGKGRLAFKTELVSGENIMADFWVKSKFKDISIITENQILDDDESTSRAMSKGVPANGEKAKPKKPKYDL